MQVFGITLDSHVVAICPSDLGLDIRTCSDRTRAFVRIYYVFSAVGWFQIFFGVCPPTVLPHGVYL